MRFPFFRNRDSVKNGILISIRRTGDGFHPGLFIFVTKIAKGQVILKNKVELPMSENGYKNIQKRFDGEDICNIDLN